MSYKAEECAKAIQQIKERNEMFCNDPGYGTFGGRPYAFVLQNPLLNLWEKIRDESIEYFKKNNIEWHNDGKDKTETSPEGHLLSSNIACINHLFYLRHKKELATAILKNIDTRIVSAKEIPNPDKEAGYVAFEINGKENYLNERSHTRGAMSTSVDAVMIGEKDDGKNILVLIEWKYTEEYISRDYNKNKGVDGQHRHDRYDPFLNTPGCPIHITNSEAIYYEPFYQLMRQTLLGWKMVENNEYGCNEFVHIHVIPDENKELLNNVPAPLLQEKSKTMCEAWKGVLKNPDTYKVISPEHFLEPLKDLSDARSLLKYLGERYWR